MFFQAGCEHVVFKQNFYVLCPAEWDSGHFATFVDFVLQPRFLYGGEGTAITVFCPMNRGQSARSRAEGTDS
jgi:hypothetical protein